MAKSTFLELCQTVRRECGISGSGLSSVVNQTGKYLSVVNWVADADLFVVSLHFDWNFLWDDSYSKTTVLGDKDYVKPTDLGTWDRTSFWIDYTSASGVHLKELGYRKWRDQYGRGVQTNNIPSQVVVKPDGDLILHPPPNTASFTLTGEYWKTPARLVANTDTSTIPALYERIIIARAKMYYAEDQGAEDVMANAEREYGTYLQLMERHELPGQENRGLMSTEPMVVRPE